MRDRVLWSRIVGRPTKCTPERSEQIARLVKAGVPIKHAAESAGVSESAVHVWLARGAKSSRGQYREFLELVTRAQAESVATLVAKVAKAASTDWRAAAWLLTRRAPDNFADPARRNEMVASEARSRVIVAEAEERLAYLEARRLVREEQECDGSPQ